MKEIKRKSGRERRGLKVRERVKKERKTGERPPERGE